MKTTLIIQARMGSSRLPGKVLEEIAGRPMLDWAVQRGKRARLIDELIVATTTDDAEDWFSYKTQTPTEYTSSFFYYYDYKFMSAFADILGEEAKEYLAKSETLKEIINRKFVAD